MKNLFGATAPSNRVLGRFKMLMLVVLVTISFASCKEQSKLEVSPETKLIANVDLQDAQSNFDIGGQGSPRRFSDIGGNAGQERRNFAISGIGGNQTAKGRYCEFCLGREVAGTFDIGGNQAPPPRRICEINSTIEIGGVKNSDSGSKGTSSDTGQIYSNDDLEHFDTGGNELGLGCIFDTGGRGNQGTTGECFVADTGGGKNATIGM